MTLPVPGASRCAGANAPSKGFAHSNKCAKGRAQSARLHWSHFGLWLGRSEGQAGIHRIVTVGHRGARVFPW